MEVVDATKLAVKVSRAAEALDISRSQTYTLIARGELPAIRIGSSVRVPLAALRAFVENRTA